jgi:hypothetical protein
MKIVQNAEKQGNLHKNRRSIAKKKGLETNFLTKRRPER